MCCFKEACRHTDIVTSCACRKSDWGVILNYFKGCVWDLQCSRDLDDDVSVRRGLVKDAVSDVFSGMTQI